MDTVERTRAEGWLQEEWQGWVLGRTWQADRDLDEWVDAVIGTAYLSRDGRPARVSKNALVLLRELALCYECEVTFGHDQTGWCVTVGNATGEYDAQSVTDDSLEVALAVATMLYFAPARRWLDMRPRPVA